MTRPKTRFEGLPTRNQPIMQSIMWLNGFDKRYREYKRLGWLASDVNG